jgi:hypothetical protein
VALILCAAFVMTDSIRKDLNRHTLISLKIKGVSPFVVFLATVVSYFLLLVFLNIVLWAVAVFGLSIEINAGLVGAVAVVLAVVATFAAMITFAFKNALSAGIFTTIFVAASLFLSGGVVPVAYFSGWLRQAAEFTFNFWATRILAFPLSGDYGGFVLNAALMCILFGLIFGALGFLAVYFKSRVGRAAL